MIRIEEKIIQETIVAISKLYQAEADAKKIQIQKTIKEYDGDYTLVVFPLLAYSRKNPQLTAEDLGNYLLNSMIEIAEFQVVKGFLNLKLSQAFWIDFLDEIRQTETYGIEGVTENSPQVVIEYASPNTNKPLHLGHIRNILLGSSMANIFKAKGKKVFSVNLINDRGIHICKSMLAWQELADGATPESVGKKGDHFVGEYYVAFDKEYKKQIAELMATGMPEEQAKEEADWLKKARGMLKRWEREHKKTRDLWKDMNTWVYAGFEETFAKLGVHFDKTYYESDTYLIGKEVVLKSLKLGELSTKPDGTVFLDLTEYGMDEKVLLRSDGTTVYMTQDIGSAILRYDDFNFDESIYVVGNEQDYHFKVLRIILDRLEFAWSNRISHLSYGMVELPEGKMKSREGTVVDADDLLLEMYTTAKNTAEQLGKLDGLTDAEKHDIYMKIALGALKYFILKVDAKKNMVFNPKESIDFNGNTGPFIQYTAVRINSLLTKANADNVPYRHRIHRNSMDSKELELIKLIYDFPILLQEADEKRSPSVLANFAYDLAKEYNQFYHNHKILNAEDEETRSFRLVLSEKTGFVLRATLGLLGIEIPIRM